MELAWDDVRLFLSVAETGSMSAAARQLALGQPTVSRRLALMEETLGYAIFQRSVEGTVLTSEGERLLEPARRMAEWAAELDRAADQKDSLPRGRVRISAPPGVAFDFLAPFAAHVKSELPDVQLEVVADVRYVDLARREADLALRIRKPDARDLLILGTLEHANAVFATPAYRKRLRRGYTIADIDWIAWAPPFDDIVPNPQLQALIPNFRPAFTSDNFLVQTRAMEAGVGAMVLGDVRHRFSRPVKTCRIPLELGAHAQSKLFMVSTKSAMQIARVRAVADLVLREFQDIERRKSTAR